MEDLENEYKKIREQEREEFNQQQQQKQQNFEDLYLLNNENEVLNAFQNSASLYERQYSTQSQNDDLSPSYTFDLPDYILSSNNNNNKDRPRSRTPSRIPTPVRNKTAASYKTGSSSTTGHYNLSLRNPSPLTVGSRIPILVASRPQSRADMYPPANDQQTAKSSPKTDGEASLSEFDKKIQKHQDAENTEIQSSIIDQIYFKRTETFNDSGNRNEMSNLLDEGLPDASLFAAALNSNNERQYSFDATNATLNDIQTTTFGGPTNNDLPTPPPPPPLPKTQEPSSNVGGAFKYYTGFADEILADVDDYDNTNYNNDESVSYNAVLNKLNSADDTAKERHQQQQREQEIKKEEIVANKPEKIPTKASILKTADNSQDKPVKPKSPVKFQTKQPQPPSTSPFISIEKHEKEKPLRKTPVSALKQNKTSQSKQQANDQKGLPPPQPPTSAKNKRDSNGSVQISTNNRPPTREMNNYSIDSEEASITENSKLDLKSKLKEEQRRRKMTDELLDQLQTNYDRLLEKHALAENVIDSLRVGAKLQIHQDATPNTMIQQVKITNSLIIFS